VVIRRKIWPLRHTFQRSHKVIENDTNTDLLYIYDFLLLLLLLLLTTDLSRTISKLNGDNGRKCILSSVLNDPAKGFLLEFCNAD